MTTFIHWDILKLMCSIEYTYTQTEKGKTGGGENTEYRLSILSFSWGNKFENFVLFVKYYQIPAFAVPISIGWLAGWLAVMRL